MVVGGYLGNRRGWAVNRALLSFNALKKNNVRLLQELLFLSFYPSVVTPDSSTMCRP